MSQAQAFMPVMTLGNYSFVYGPNGLQFDRETSVAEHPILTGAEQTEPIGWTAKKLTYNGFLYSLNNQSLTDSQNWTSNDGFFNRPVVVNIFSQDSSGTSSSQPWYSDVGYLQSAHFEQKGGYGIYKYWYRFSWIQALPITLLATTTTINSSNKTYSFTMTGQPPGYIAGIQLQGTSIGTNALVQSIVNVKDNASTTIGSGPSLGSAANQLFLNNPQLLFNTLVNSYPLDYPVTDSSLNQSIQRTTAPTGTYTATFLNTWDGSNLPSGISLIYIPL